MGVPPRHVYEILIRTTPERLWRAITDPADTQLYYYGTKVQSDWKPGSRLVYLDGDEVSLDCEILEIEPPHRLVHTFTMVYDPEIAAERPSRVTWSIEQQGDVCRLTLVHDDFDGETRTYTRSRTAGQRSCPVSRRCSKRAGRCTPATQERRPPDTT
jgi:Uncharacterized conserved protein